jgi:hypothetical protein
MAVLEIRVWLSKSRLTRLLAAGVAPAESRALDMLAGRLTSRHTRDELADSIDDLLEQASRPRVRLTAQVPFDHQKVKSAHDSLVGLADRLRGPKPVSPQGMALSLLLLTDAEQPLFGIGSPGDLTGAIMWTTRRLDP